MFKKSQSSTEFLAIFGIGFIIILVLGGIFFNYFNTEKQTLDEQQLTNIGEKIISEVERIYFLGPGNKITINTNFPSGIEEISIKHYENVTVNSRQTSFDYLVIRTNKNQSLMFNTNENYIRFNCSTCYYNASTNTTYFNDSSLISPGSKKIQVEGRENYVEINFVR